MHLRTKTITILTTIKRITPIAIPIIAPIDNFNLDPDELFCSKIFSSEVGGGVGFEVGCGGSTGSKFLFILILQNELNS